MNIKEMDNCDKRCELWELGQNLAFLIITVFFIGVYVCVSTTLTGIFDFIGIFFFIGIMIIGSTFMVKIILKKFKDILFEK